MIHRRYKQEQLVHRAIELWEDNFQYVNITELDCICKGNSTKEQQRRCPQARITINTERFEARKNLLIAQLKEEGLFK